MKTIKEFIEKLYEYIFLIKDGKIDYPTLDFELSSLDSKARARRLANRILKEAPKEVKKVLAVASKKPNVMVQWFIEALKEKQVAIK
jgi:hypothetical protein